MMEEALKAKNKAQEVLELKLGEASKRAEYNAKLRAEAVEKAVTVCERVQKQIQVWINFHSNELIGVISLNSMSFRKALHVPNTDN